MLPAETKARISGPRANAALVILKLAELKRSELESSELRVELIHEPMAELEEQRREFDSPDGSTIDDSNPSCESGPDDVKQPDDVKGPDKVEAPDDRERNAENETSNAIGAAPPVPEREAEQRSPEEEVWQSLVHSVSHHCELT